MFMEYFKIYYIQIKRRKRKISMYFPKQKLYKIYPFYSTVRQKNDSFKNQFTPLLSYSVQL